MRQTLKDKAAAIEFITKVALGLGMKEDGEERVRGAAFMTEDAIQVVFEICNVYGYAWQQKEGEVHSIKIHSRRLPQYDRALDQVKLTSFDEKTFTENVKRFLERSRKEREDRVVDDERWRKDRQDSERIGEAIEQMLDGIDMDRCVVHVNSARDIRVIFQGGEEEVMNILRRFQK